MTEQFEIFEFPFHTVQTIYPNTSPSTSFGGFQSAARPKGVDQVTYQLNFPAMQYFMDPITEIADPTIKPLINMQSMEEFYERMGTFEKFVYPHPVKGLIIVRFAEPLQPPGGVPDGNGVTEAFTLKLIYQPLDNISGPPIGRYIRGPATAINDRIAIFDGPLGSKLKDGGYTIADLIGGFHFDKVIPFHADLDDYDAQPEKYAVLVIDAAAIYVKMSNTSGDWSDPVPVGGVGASATSIGVKIDASGTILELSDYDTEDQNFVFFAIDEGKLYIKLSAASGDWSTGVDVRGPVGVGKTGPISISVIGGIASNELLLMYPFVAPRHYAANFAGSYAKLRVAPLADAVFSIQKNFVEIGTITFPAGQTVGVWSAIAVTFAALDILSIFGPNPRDSQLASLAIAIVSDT